MPNILQRKFQQPKEKQAVVADLTYVRVNNKWNYLCVLVDLFNREIIGFSSGAHKDKALVARAFASVKGNLRQIQLFHTDRGSEFKNDLIEETLKTFGISRSLSKRGCPYDNAVAEATFKIIKWEFVRQTTFASLGQLHMEFSDYVNWFNRFRIHGTLGYVSPIDFKQLALIKVVSFCVDNSVLNVPGNWDASLFCIFVREKFYLNLYRYVVADPMNLYLVVQIAILYSPTSSFVVPALYHN